MPQEKQAFFDRQDRTCCLIRRWDWRLCPTLQSLHESKGSRMATGTGLEPAASCVRGRRARVETKEIGKQRLRPSQDEKSQIVGSVREEGKKSHCRTWAETCNQSKCD